ncbi:hypothetical protein ASC84_06755 [Acinetobacter sp. Root1280]|uniref:DUF4882 family protein n=1 Tax=Acinetobacter sp. Root1280 TaxID=1736444 RepID=UPI0006FEB4E3|nr:DUF4882 family protein [Acinetobacter sp. Root1280]KQW98431.1 hypothetical protein ASC84_06755 [Acinetobacter sp. Root1280]
MKRMICGLMINSICISSWAACSYDFDATQTQISVPFQGFQKFPSIIGQKTSFTVASTSSPQMFVAANSAAISGQNNGLTVPQSGIFAYEYKIKVPTTLLPNNEQIIMYPNYADAYYNGGKNQIVVMYANHLQGSAAPDKVIFVVGSTNDGNNGLIELPVSNTSDGYQKIGIYVNQNSNQVGIIYNGINQGYISSNPSKFINLAFTNGFSYYDIGQNSPNIGKEYSVELITDKNKFQFTYPVGTTDICGNTI